MVPLTCGIIVLMMSPFVASTFFTCLPNASSYSFIAQFSECDLTPEERATVVANVQFNILPNPVFLLNEPFYLSYAVNVTNFDSFSQDWLGSVLDVQIGVLNHSALQLAEVTFARIIPHMDLVYDMIASSEQHTLYGANNWVNATYAIPFMTVPEISLLQNLVCIIMHSVSKFLEVRIYSRSGALMVCQRINMEIMPTKATTFSRPSTCAAPLTIDNVNVCTNGGTFINDSCLCPAGFHGSWCEYACFHGKYVCSDCINGTMFYNQTSGMEACCQCEAGYVGYGCSVNTNSPIGNITAYVNNNNDGNYLTNDNGLLQYSITFSSSLPAALCPQALHSIQITYAINPPVVPVNSSGGTIFLCAPGNTTYEHTALYQTWPYRIYNVSSYYVPSRNSFDSFLIGTATFRAPEAAPHAPTFRISTRGPNANLTFTISHAECTGLIRKIDVDVIPDAAQSVHNRNFMYISSYDCFITTSFNITVNGLDPGSYRLRVRLHTIVPGNWSDLSDEITVPAKPLLTTSQVIGICVENALIFCLLLICAGLAIQYRKRFQNLYSVLDRWFPNPIVNSDAYYDTKSSAGSFSLRF